MGTMVNLDISRSEDLSEHFKTLYLSEAYSDLIIHISDEKIPAHKNILSARSPYFEELLKKSDRILTLEGFPVDVFKHVLKYIYTGRMSIDNAEIATVLKIFELACVYGLNCLKSSLLGELKKGLKIENVVQIINMADKYQVEELLTICEEYLDVNANNFLKDSSFTNITEACLIRILKRDTFSANELSIFQAVCQWSGHDKVKAKEVIKQVRWSLIYPADFGIIIKTGMVDNDVLVQALQEACSGRKETHREFLKESSDPVLEAKNKFYTFWNSKNVIKELSLNSTGKFVRSVDNIETCFNFDTPIEINHIWFDLGKNFECGYKITVSEDETNFIQIISYWDYNCHSEQFLYFSRRKVKYIRIQTDQSNECLFVEHIKVFCLRETPKFYPNNIVIPNANVTSIATNRLLHKSFNSGKYVWKLNQPYALNSLKFKLSKQLSDVINYIIIDLITIDNSQNPDIQMKTKGHEESLCFDIRIITKIEFTVHVLHNNFWKKFTGSLFSHLEAPIVGQIQ